MSKVITQSLAGGIMHAFSLADKFVSVCPEEVWGKKFGSWPVWQQLYHSFASVDFFLRSPNAPEAAPLFKPGIAELRESAQETPSKTVVQKFMEETQARINEYIAGLDDTSLCDTHEGLSARLGNDFTHAGVLGLIASHTLYHLGCCDAALREHGIPGVF